MPIPAGSFTMGSPPTEAGRTQAEGPQTRVTITHPFWLGQTNVTQLQWRAIMGTGVEEEAQKMLADNAPYDFGPKLGHITTREFIRWRDRGAPLVCNVGDDVPIYWISWAEAVEFCRRLTERERAAGRLPAGYEYRLPTEAEWEYACRAGTTTATYIGDLKIEGSRNSRNAPILDEIAWYGGNSSVGYAGKGYDTANWKEKQYPGGIAAQRSVAKKRANAWGLYDMIGNVCSWCGDWYADTLPGGEVRDPVGPATGTFRVERGGSWFGFAKWERAAQRFREPTGFRDSDIGLRVALCPVRGAEPRVIPDLGLKLMPIPAGTFVMGSPPSEFGHMDWEGPQTRVTISHSFWLGQTPVTQAQWKAIMGTSVAQQTQLADAKHRGLYHQGDNVPMYYIDWAEAVEFCHRLTERERAAGRLPDGYEYRLPTEAEWEYACRAGTTTATYAGDLDVKGERNAPILDEIAWYGGNSSVGYTDPGRDTTNWKEKQYPGGIAGEHEVAMKRPNAWGLYDMIGNVAGWCEDWYADRLPGGAVTDPVGPASGKFRTFRTGSWIGFVRWSRSAARFIGPPDFRDMDVGVRVALCQVRQPN